MIQEMRGRSEQKMGSTDRVKAAAAAAGLNIDVNEMAQSTRTAAEAAVACGTTVGQIVKSLVFRKARSGGLVLLLVSGANRVDQAAIADVIGEPLERADADAVREATGFAIGGVAPIGSLTPLPTFMDAALTAYPFVWAAAGAPHAVFAVEPLALAAASGARIIALTPPPGSSPV
jgi:prolyl-tRNA editing enzyme YbaK/EbsC (Cys-tRNA(Pro) deacylase)